MTPLLASVTEAIFMLLLGGVAIFLILLVLVQRGRGGGLAGALGGMGGSSAFGAKSGDVFTKITVVAAAFWILLCIAAVKFAAPTGGSRVNVPSTATTSDSGSSGPAISAVAKDKGESSTKEAAPEGDSSETAPAEESNDNADPSAPSEEDSK